LDDISHLQRMKLHIFMGVASTRSRWVSPSSSSQGVEDPHLLVILRVRDARSAYQGLQLITIYSSLIMKI